LNTFLSLLTQAVTGVPGALTDLQAFFTDRWNDILALFGLAANAQESADYANAQLAAASRLIVDLFDAPYGALSASWDTDYVGAGGGAIYMDGTGFLRWLQFGGLPRLGLARYNATVTTTDRQVVSTVMPDPVDAPFGGGDSYLYLLGRVNNTSTIGTAVYGRAESAGASLGCFVGGVETVFDSAPVSVARGDVWDLWVGSVADAREFTFIRNGVPVITWTDSAAVSSLGAGFRSVGLGMLAADRAFGGQTLPGSMAVFSADDR
jgi:hypothetical protein